MVKALIFYIMSLFGEVDGAVRVDVGRLSVYRPGDGWNKGELACGGRYTDSQVHIAHRDWRRLGCGRKVLVCAEVTGKCVVAKVMDAGPWGIYRGPLRRAVPEKRWRIWTNPKPPKGWRFRAVTDLSWALWKKLGKPAGLSNVKLVFFEKKSKNPAIAMTHFGY